MAVNNVATGGLEDISGFLAGVIVFFIYGVPISYGAMLVLGLPYVLWLKRSKRFTMRNISLGAIVAGTVTFTAFWTFGHNLPQPLVFYSFAGSLLGFASGLAFVAVVGPNKRVKNDAQKARASYP